MTRWHSLLKRELLLGSIAASFESLGIGATVYPAATASGIEACLLDISCFSAVFAAAPLGRDEGRLVVERSASTR